MIIGTISIIMTLYMSQPKTVSTSILISSRLLSFAPTVIPSGLKVAPFALTVIPSGLKVAPFAPIIAPSQY